MQTTTETIAQRQKRIAKEYAAQDAPLDACNRAARKASEELRAKTSDLAVAAMEAVARSLGGASASASEVLKSVNADKRGK